MKLVTNKRVVWQYFQVDNIGRPLTSTLHWTLKAGWGSKIDRNSHCWRAGEGGSLVQGGMRLLSGPPPSPISTNTTKHSHPTPVKMPRQFFHALLSSSSSLFTSSTLPGFGEQGGWWPLVGSPCCLPPACYHRTSHMCRCRDDGGPRARGPMPLPVRGRPASTVTLGDTRRDSV